MKNKKDIDTVEKQERQEKVLTAIMAAILIACIAVVVWMLGVTFGSKTSSNSSSGDTATSETATSETTVKPGEDSVETVEIDGVTYEVKVPGTLNFDDFDETDYLGSDGRYKFDTSASIDDGNITMPAFLHTASEYVATDEEVAEAIDGLADSYKELKEADADHVTEAGDTVKVSYKGTINGVELENVAEDNAEVTIGSGSYIKNFEDALIGHKNGETFEADVLFPADYTQDGTESGEPVTVYDDNGTEVTLTNNTVHFEFTLSSVGKYEKPEITDDWVKENIGDANSIPVNTVAELEDYYRVYLYYNDLISDVNTYVTETVEPLIKFNSIPEELLNYIYYSTFNSYNSYAVSSNTTLDQLIYNQSGYNMHDYIVNNLEDIIDQSKQLLTWDWVYGKCLEDGAADVSDDQQFHKLMGEVLGYDLDDDTLDALIKDNGDEYSRNYCTQYSIADYLVRE